MGEVRKALKKALGWRAYMMRDKEERRESISWKRKMRDAYKRGSSLFK